MKIAALKNYRARIEERCKAECEAVRRELEETQAARARLEAEEERHVRDYLDRSRVGIVPSEAAHYATSLDALASLIAKTKEREEALQRHLERKQAEALDASRERKQFERLEARHDLARRRTEEHRAQQTMDDAAGRGAIPERGMP